MTLPILIGVLCYLLYAHGFSKYALALITKEPHIDGKLANTVINNKQLVYSVLFILCPLFIFASIIKLLLKPILGIFK